MKESQIETPNNQVPPIPVLHFLPQVLLVILLLFNDVTSSAPWDDQRDNNPSPLSHINSSPGLRASFSVWQLMELDMANLVRDAILHTAATWTWTLASSTGCYFPLNIWIYSCCLTSCFQSCFLELPFSPSTLWLSPWSQLGFNAWDCPFTPLVQSVRLTSATRQT